MVARLNFASKSNRLRYSFLNPFVDTYAHKWTAAHYSLDNLHTRHESDAAWLLLRRRRRDTIQSNYSTKWWNTKHVLSKHIYRASFKSNLTNELEIFIKQSHGNEIFYTNIHGTVFKCRARHTFLINSEVSCFSIEMLNHWWFRARDKK